MSVVYDVIVVGGGVEGSATAYNLAMEGRKTLLLDKYPLPHSRGSSHGHSRITRMSYDKDFYARMMLTAFRMWEQLEKAEHVEIYKPCGLLTMAANDKRENLDKTIQCLKDVDAPHDYLDHHGITKRYPMFKLDSTFFGVDDPSGGILRADRALAALWNQFKKYGGEIRDGEPVTTISPGQTVTVTTSRGQYRANSVVICAGPWTSKLVAPLGLHLPLKPVRVGVYYWKALTNQFSFENGMPSCHFFNIVMNHSMDIYGMPALEYPGHFKLCCHGGPEIDPENRDSKPANDMEKDIIDNMNSFVRDRFPGLEPHPSVQEACTYTYTPDKDFILDYHPKWQNIVIGAGFSGHGFKLAPVVGKLLSELATGRSPSFDVSPFRIGRFPNTGLSSNN